MPDPVSKSLDLLTAKSWSQLKLTDLLYAADPDETDPDDFNRKTALSALRDFLLANLTVSTDVSAGAQEVAVSWPATISPAPTVAPVAMFYPSALEDVGIVCWLKGGTLSGTGVTVILSSDNHSGGKLTVLMPPPGTA